MDDLPALPTCAVYQPVGKTAQVHLSENRTYAWHHDIIINFLPEISGKGTAAAIALPEL